MILDELVRKLRINSVGNLRCPTMNVMVNKQDCTFCEQAVSVYENTVLCKRTRLLSQAEKEQRCRK